MSKISYSAVVLDDQSRYVLLDSLKNFIPEYWYIFAHHVTICLGELPEDWKYQIGNKVRLSYDYLGKNDTAIAIKIDNFDRIIKGQSHITIAVDVANGGKPKDSNLIQSWDIELEDTQYLYGTIQEIPYESETKRYNNLILKELNEYNNKDVNGDLRFGQILSNLNINYFVDKENPALANFNLKDIYNQSSKEIYERLLEQKKIY